MGIFTKKSLSDVVDGILAREQKINNRIREIELKIKVIENGIPKKVKELVGYEIAGDMDGQNKCKEDIKQDRQQIVELQDLLDAYNSEKKSLVFITDKEMGAIKSLGSQIIETRTQQLKELLTERDMVKRQIEELTKKEKDLWVEHKRIDDDKEEVNQVRRILKYIDTDALKFSNPSRFIRSWILNNNTEQYFKIAGIERNK